MDTHLTVIGVDPGLTTGIASVHLRNRVVTNVGVLQCNAEITADMLRGLLGIATSQRRLAIERFVVRGRAGRASSARAGAITRDLIGELEAVVRDEGVPVAQRPAAQVKPWATDERLEAVGLLLPTKGMGHARDATRHALYEAVHGGFLADPLRGKL